MQLEQEQQRAGGKFHTDGDELYVQLKRDHHHDGGRDQVEDERSAEIGLLGDERSRERQQSQRGRNVTPRPQRQVHRLSRKQLRQGDDQRNLDQLRRLDAERGESQPAP